MSSRGPHTVREALEAGADYIERYGWLQGRFGSTAAPGPVCAAGALLAVTLHQVTVKVNDLYGQAYNALNDYLHERGHNGAIHYNDAYGRTEEEVVATMRAAALEASS